MNTLRVALDGPAGAGKSSVAKRVAAVLGVAYVDTGAMYRAITWKALQEGIELHDEAALTDMANSTRIDFEPRPEGQAVFVDGTEVTDAIRSLDITNNVSAVAAVSGVRSALVKIQRDIASRTGVLMDGRDIGTVVLPNADVKIWLTASVEERANRRYQELLSKGVACDLAQIQEDIQRRDDYDASREHSPMVKADGAVVVDTTGMSIDAVIEEIQSICRSAQAQNL